MSAWFEGWKRGGTRLKHRSRIAENSLLEGLLKILRSYLMFPYSMILSPTSQQRTIHTMFEQLK